MTLKFCVFHFSAVFFARIFSFCPWNRQLQQQQQWKLVRSPRFDKQHSHSLLFNETISLESTFRSLEINKHTHYALCAYIFEWLTLVLRPKYEYIYMFAGLGPFWHAIHSSTHPSNQAAMQNQQMFEMSSWREIHFIRAKKAKEKRSIDFSNGTHSHTLWIVSLENWLLLIYRCMRRDVVCLLINSCSFLSIFFARRQCTHTSMEYKL